MRYVTHCPSCGTVFKIVDDQLRIAQGWVRCGHCQAVYKAKETLSVVIDEPEPATAATTPTAATAADTADTPAPPPAVSEQTMPTGTSAATEPPAIAEETDAAQEPVASVHLANDASTGPVSTSSTVIAANSMLDRIAAIVANKKNAAQQAAAATEDHTPHLTEETPAPTSTAAPSQQTVAEHATSPTASPDDAPEIGTDSAATETTETPATAADAARAETTTQANARPMLDWEDMPQPAAASTPTSPVENSPLPDDAVLQWQEGEPFPDPQPPVPAFLRKMDAPGLSTEEAPAPTAPAIPALPAPSDSLSGIQAAIETTPTPAAFAQADDDSAHSIAAENRAAPDTAAEDRQTPEETPVPAAVLASVPAADDTMAEATPDTVKPIHAEIQPLAETLQEEASLTEPKPTDLAISAEAADTAAFSGGATQETRQEPETSAEASASEEAPDQAASQSTTADNVANSANTHDATAASQRRRERRGQRRLKSKDGTSSRKHRDKAHDKKPAGTRTWWQALLDQFTTTTHHANHSEPAKPPVQPPALPSKPVTKQPTGTPSPAIAATAVVTGTPSLPQVPTFDAFKESGHTHLTSDAHGTQPVTDPATTAATAIAPATNSTALAATETPILSSSKKTFAFMRDAQRRAFWRRPQVRAALLAGIVAGSLTLVGQWAYRHRSSLAARIPLARFTFQALGWQVPPWQNIQAIEIQDSDFLKNTDDSYQLRVSLRNTSTHPVAMPALELALLDDDEQVVARRVITSDPALPMPAILPPRGQWDAISEVHVQLPPTLAQHGVSGYRVAVFYP